MEDKIKKLPKWAQDHISSLERKYKDRGRQIDRLNGEAMENYSGEVYLGYKLVGTQMLLPESEVYTFCFAEDNKISVHIDRDILSVSTNGSSMKVNPRASNSIHVGF